MHRDFLEAHENTVATEPSSAYYYCGCYTGPTTRSFLDLRVVGVLWLD